MILIYKLATVTQPCYIFSWFSCLLSSIRFFLYFQFGENTAVQEWVLFVFEVTAVRQWRIHDLERGSQGVTGADGRRTWGRGIPSQLGKGMDRGCALSPEMFLLFCILTHSEFFHVNGCSIPPNPSSVRHWYDITDISTTCIIELTAALCVITGRPTCVMASIVAKILPLRWRFSAILDLFGKYSFPRLPFARMQKDRIGLNQTLHIDSLSGWTWRYIWKDVQAVSRTIAPGNPFADKHPQIFIPLL